MLLQDLWLGGADNGTNFVGTDRGIMQSLQEWNQLQIADFLSRKQIQRHFNSPGSPHFGGIWELLVPLGKKALKVVFHGQVVTDEVLETAFAETEALVNSRPHTEVTSCSSDLEAITLTDFLISRAKPVLPCGVFGDKEISSKKRWRHLQVLINQVWARWLCEYLPTLIARKKWI